MMAALGAFRARPVGRRSLWQRHWLRRARRNAGDAVRAFGYLSRAALSGDGEAQLAVGLGYLHGRGVPPHHGAATQWLERAASNGQADAMVNLAKMALQGLLPGGNPDFARGQLWAARAADAGATEGKLLLANLALFGPCKDLRAATTLFREVAADGSAPGRLGLAMALMHGEAAHANRDEIAHLIDLAAHQGLPMAQYFAGVRRQFGLGTEPDPARAAEFYRQSASSGVRAAQTRYGFALLLGLGVRRNPDAGETWLRRATSAGDAAAAALLGMTYATEGDLPPNFTEACLWFRRAVELGHPLTAPATPHLAAQAAHFLQCLRELGPLFPSGDPASRLAGLYRNTPSGCSPQTN